MKVISISNEVKGVFVCMASPDNLNTIKTNLKFFGVNQDEIENVLLNIEFKHDVMKKVDDTLITISDVTYESPSIH